MIKCGLFGNSLKRLYSILLIICFLLLGNFSKAEFVSSGYYYNSLSDVYSDNGGYTYYVGSDGNFNTSDIDFNSEVFYWPYIENSVYNHYNIGWIDGNLYFDQYLSNSNGISSIQGFIEKWCISSVSSRQSSNSYLHSDCVYNKTLNQVKSSISGSFSSYAFEVVGSQRPIWFFTSSPLQYCLSDGINDFCFECGVTTCPSGLTGSLNLSLSSFQDISNYSWGYSPFSVYKGSTTGNFDNTLTGSYTYYDCTYKDILTWLNTEGYNKYICYGGLDNFDLYDSTINYNPIPGSGLSISQIWAWSGSRAWDNFSQWFSFWFGIYRDSDNNYNAMWESYPAVYRTYFQLYNTYKSTQYGSVVSINNILNYCQLMENVNNPNFDLNSSVGGYFKPACESIVREKQTGVWDSRVDGSIYSDGVYTGDVPISVNWDGVGNMSGMSGQKDGLNFIQDFFNLNKTVLQNDYNNLTGIIPGYILVFLFGLILFRFISR